MMIKTSNAECLNTDDLQFRFSSLFFFQGIYSPVNNLTLSNYPLFSSFTCTSNTYIWVHENETSRGYQYVYYSAVANLLNKAFSVPCYSIVRSLLWFLKEQEDRYNRATQNQTKHYQHTTKSRKMMIKV